MSRDQEGRDGCPKQMSYRCQSIWKVFIVSDYIHLWSCLLQEGLYLSIPKDIVLCKKREVLNNKVSSLLFWRGENKNNAKIIWRNCFLYLHGLFLSRKSSQCSRRGLNVKGGILRLRAWEKQEVLGQLQDVLWQAEYWITIASVRGPSTWWVPRNAHNVPTLQGLEESCWKRRHGISSYSLI